MRHFFAKNDYRLEPFFREKRSEMNIIINPTFRINRVYTLNVNIKLEAQQKKLKTARGSYTDLDLSRNAKKGPEKSRDTLPLKAF